MRTTTPQGARPDIYDRNPVMIIRGAAVSSGAAGRASTTDWTYTVPAGKKFQIVQAYTHMSEVTGVAINNYAEAQIEAVAGGTSKRILLSRIVPGGEPMTTQSLGSGGVLLAGDIVRGITGSFNSAAVTIAHETGLLGVEFDA